MSNRDPRYRNGVFKGFDPFERKSEQLDSPLLHGWKRTELTDNGHALFELDRAQLRTTGPEDNCPHEWLVFVQDDVYGFDGSLADITADVCKMLGIAVPVQQPYFLPQTVIPAMAFRGERDE